METLKPVKDESHGSTTEIQRGIEGAGDAAGVGRAKGSSDQGRGREGIHGTRRDKSRRTNIAGRADAERSLDLVERRFTATTPDQLWVADLTDIRTHAGRLYAVFVIDAFPTPRMPPMRDIQRHPRHVPDNHPRN